MKFNLFDKSAFFFYEKLLFNRTNIKNSSLSFISAIVKEVALLR
jgi:hypothetical protein